MFEFFDHPSNLYILLLDNQKWFNHKIYKWLFLDIFKAEIQIVDDTKKSTCTENYFYSGAKQEKNRLQVSYKSFLFK